MRVARFRLGIILRTRWRATLALTVVVAVAGGFVLLIAAGAARTLTVSDRYVASQDVAFDVIVEQQGGRAATSELAALAAVSDVRSVTFVFGALIPNGGEVPIESLVFAGQQAAFGTRVDAGREPDPSRPDEFVASQSFIDSTGAELGDRFTLITIGQEQADQSGFDVETPDGPTIEATLVGTYTGPTELQDGYASVMFPPALLDTGDIGISASQHAVELAPGATDHDLRVQLDGLTDAQFGIDPADVVPEPVRDAIEARGQGILVVSVILVVAAVATVGQLLGRRVRLSDLEKETMRAVGMTRRQLVADPVDQAAVPIVAGTALGVVWAVACSGRFPLGFVRVIEPDPGPYVDPLVHVLGAALFGLALLAWVTVTVIAERRERPPRRPSAGVDAIARHARPVQAAMAVRFTFTRASRDSSSPVAPLVGLVVVLAAVVASLTFGVSLDRQLTDGWRYGAPDVQVGEGGSEIDPQVRQKLLESPAVDAVAAAGTVLTSIGSHSVDISALQPLLGDLRPSTLSGRLPLADDEVTLGRVTARELGIDVGDEVEVSGAGGTETLRVVGFAILPSVNGGDGLGLGGLVTVDELTRLDPDATLGVLNVDLDAGTSSEELARLSALVGTELHPPDPPEVILNLQRVRSLPFVVAGTLGVLAALSLAHQLLMSFQNRRRDVAVLGALGADRRWMTWMVHWQATLTAVFVLALALPCGFGAGRVVYRAFIDRVGSDDGVTLPPWMLAALVVVTVLLANVVAAPPARRLRHLPLVRYLGED